MSESEKTEIWERVRAGTSFRLIGRQLGRASASVRTYVGSTGGVRPPERMRAPGRLCRADREEISRGLAAGESIRSVARRLGAGRASAHPADHAPGPGAHLARSWSRADRGRGGDLRAAGRGADRAVPGHGEGDLLLGSGLSQIATLVERQSRFLLLVKLEAKTTDAVVTALAARVQTLPEALRRSLTGDRGLELAEHLRFTVDTGVKVYFCDPKSPWQRGSNENTNGLLRQYFPKGTSLAPFSQDDLDAVAARLNSRPRQTLSFLTPSQKLSEALR
jgi:IS30 family transposase